MANIIESKFKSFGNNYAGYAVPSPSSANTNVLISNNNKPGQTRFIDPNTGDYVFDDNGRIVGGNAIQQMVYLAIKTIRGSSAVADLGQSFSNVKTIGANYITLVKNEVNKSLKYMIDNKLIQLIDVVVNQQGTQAQIQIKWKDIATGTDYTNNI